MVTRADLLAHFDVLTEEGYPPICHTLSIAEASVWTSDDPDDQAKAARLCLPCPALGACREYGLERPKELGVYGGLTETERRRATPNTHPNGETA